MFIEILKSKPHNPHYLNRYIKYITHLLEKNKDLSSYEGHHICPKAKDLWPEYSSFRNFPWNKVKLKSREHFIAHIMLAKIYGESQLVALFHMSNIKGMKINSKLYEKARIEHSLRAAKNLSSQNKGKISVKDPVTGVFFKVKPDDPRWISGELVGAATGCSSNITGKLSGYIQAKDKNGVCHRVKPDDPRWISGELVGVNKGMIQTKESRRKISEKTKGVKKPKGFGDKISKSKKGVAISEHTKTKLKKANLGKKWYYNPLTFEKICLKNGSPPPGFLRGLPKTRN